MKIILSRKGFDSAYGGVPSPLLPTGELVSLPIPERPGAVTSASRTYGGLTVHGHPVDPLVHALTKGRITAGSPVHFDPDLDAASLPSRPLGWRGMFGQTGGSQTHLQSLGVGPGDVFLFFGWFRETRPNALGRLQYKPGAPDLHVCFGWLQIERWVPVVPLAGLPPYAAAHPHAKPLPYGHPDGIYFATKQLTLPGISAPGLPGAGLLRTYDPKRCLTASAHTRRFWRLPGWFYPPPPKPPLSYHSAASFSPLPGGDVLLKSVCQGQEFVLDCDHYPPAIPWLHHILA